MTTYVFFKDGSDKTIALNLSLDTVETLVSATIGAIEPAPSIGASVVSGPGPAVLIALTGGDDGVTYGIPVTVQTNLRTIECVAAVSVQLGAQGPYVSQNPDSYTDLIGRLAAGNSALATCVFPLPAEVDPTHGHVVWELVDEQGIVYASGNAFSYKITDNGINKVVVAQSVVTAPSDTPPTVDRPYQLRYTLKVQAQLGMQDKFYSYENLVIDGLAVLPLGTQSTVEVQGDPATVYIVLDQAYERVEVELFQDNTSIGSLLIPEATRVSSGYYYSATFDTSGLPVSLEPYTVVWKYTQGGPSYRDRASLWVVNPMIMTAIDDAKAKINKARTTLYGTEDHQFPVEQVMLWLRRAADAFNGSYGVFTQFTFTKAKGSIREYWLMYAELFALEAQYLAEGEKAFNFQGANISLDVDRTQFLDSAASKIQQRLDNEFKAFKQNLVVRGNISGAGDLDPTKLQRGAIGAVGISISPATPWGRFAPLYPRR